MQHERRWSCARGADVSFRDVKIETPDRKFDRGMWMMSCPEALRILGIWWKVRVQYLPRKKVDFQSSPRPCSVCRAWWGGGADGKVSIERLCLSSYVEKPFNSKVIKSFVPELRSRKCFCISGFLCYLYILFTQPLRSDRIWHKVNFLSGV